MTSVRAELLARSNRLGADPRNTNYAGGNTSAKGTETDPVTGGRRRAAVGQGLRRRPRHAHRAGPGRAAARPAARAGRRLPRRRARGRDGRRLRLLPARPGRCRAVHRHRHARPGRRRPRRPPAPRLRHRDRHRRRRRGADPGDLRRPGGLGAVAPPRLPARPGHRRRPAGQPAGDRLRPRRARHHRVGRDQRRVRGQLAGDHPHRRGVHRRAHRAPRRRGPHPFGPVRPGYEPLPEDERRARAARAGPGAARAGLHRPPAGRPLHRHRGGARLPRPREARPAGRARHLLPRPLPAHQGPAAGPRPARHRTARRGRRPARASCTRRTGRTTAPTTSGTPTADSRRCAAPTRRSCWSPASACSPSARTSRPPGWPASSTSTPST